MILLCIFDAIIVHRAGFKGGHRWAIARGRHTLGAAKLSQIK